MFYRIVADYRKAGSPKNLFILPSITMDPCSFGRKRSLCNQTQRNYSKPEKHPGRTGCILVIAAEWN
jgi:hypothetical protein